MNEVRVEGLKSELAASGDGDAVSSNGSTHSCLATGGKGFATCSRCKASLAGGGIGRGAGDDDSPAIAAFRAKTTSAASEGFEGISAAGSMTRFEGEEWRGSLNDSDSEVAILDPLLLLLMVPLDEASEREVKELCNILDKDLNEPVNLRLLPTLADVRCTDA